MVWLLLAYAPVMQASEASTTVRLPAPTKSASETPATVQAAGEVTACSDDVEFSSKLAGGGFVSFNCGGSHAQAVIPLSSYKAISLNTTIDGGGVVTLDGHNLAIPRDSKQFELMGPGATLTLTNITLANGYADTAYSSGDGGCIRAGANSRLVLLTVNLRNCRTPDGYAGGGIYITDTASVLMIQSTLSGSSATSGGGIYNAGTLTLSGSLLSSNVVTGSGGGLLNLGTATLSGSYVLSNTATQNGGGLKNSGRLTLDHVSVNGNAATSGGGMINQGGTATLNDTTLDSNSALASGGGIQNSGTAMLSGSTLSNNLAGTGGGGGIANNYAMTLTNVTLSANTAAFGGGIDNNLTMTLANTTLANNSAADGDGIFQLTDSAMSLNNSIIAYSATGSNCSGSISTAQYSLSSDSSCTLTGTGNLASTDPLLSALDNYGGPTLVHMLKTGSPAINAVGGGAPANDQRGVTRPQPAAGLPDMGSVERRASDSDFPPRLYLPVVRR